MLLLVRWSVDSTPWGEKNPIVNNNKNEQHYEDEFSFVFSDQCDAMYVIRFFMLFFPTIFYAIEFFLLAFGYDIKSILWGGWNIFR